MCRRCCLLRAVAFGRASPYFLLFPQIVLFLVLDSIGEPFQSASHFLAYLLRFSTAVVSASSNCSYGSFLVAVVARYILPTSCCSFGVRP